MYVASESEVTCVCAINLGQVADEGSATSYKVRPPLFTATYLQFYNKSSPYKNAVLDVEYVAGSCSGRRSGSISDL